MEKMKKKFAIDEKVKIVKDKDDYKLSFWKAFPEKEEQTVLRTLKAWNGSRELV